MRLLCGKIRDFEAFGWCLVSLITIGMAAWAFYSDWQHAKQMLAMAVTTTATVTESDEGVPADSHGDGGESPWIQYRFQAHDKLTYTGGESNRYQRTGSKIQVLYLPSDPTVNHVSFPSALSYARRESDYLVFVLLVVVGTFGFWGQAFDRHAEPSGIPFSRSVVIVLCFVSMIASFKVHANHHQANFMATEMWTVSTSSLVIAFYAWKWRLLGWVPWAFGLLAVATNPLLSYWSGFRPPEPTWFIGSIAMILAAFAVNPLNRIRD